MDKDLPRHQIPGLFHPHRTEFICKHELIEAPQLDKDADWWFHEAMALDTPDLWKDDRDWPKIIALYTKAAECKHWKAMNNLATLYQTGVRGLRDPDKVLLARQPQLAMALTEEAMRMGVPQAYAVMGNYYQSGFIVPSDATAAWAFWQKAADMGSSYAQLRIGSSLNASHDDPDHLFWGNKRIGVKMLECSFAQGNGGAAHELGLTYSIENEYQDNPRALHYFHDGVKFGSATSASNLWLVFKKTDILAPNGIDNARADRYLIFKRALERNPDLRFPNLDKVLPLPPAPLPPWNRNPKDLLEAAGPVMLAAGTPGDATDAGFAGQQISSHWDRPFVEPPDPSLPPPPLRPDQIAFTLYVVPGVPQLTPEPYQLYRDGTLLRYGATDRWGRIVIDDYVRSSQYELVVGAGNRYTISAKPLEQAAGAGSKDSSEDSSEVADH